MRIFLKYSSPMDLELLNHYPIHGMVFNITEGNAEAIREIRQKLPFYITVCGQLPPLPKYKLEEIIYFCKLDSLIITEGNYQEELSCPQIAFQGNLGWNGIFVEDQIVTTGNVLWEQILTGQIRPSVLAITKDELERQWSLIMDIWART